MTTTQGGPGYSGRELPGSQLACQEAWSPSAGVLPDGVQRGLPPVPACVRGSALTSISRG